MSYNITVLYHGRRSRVTAKINSPLYQVLDDACKSFNVDPKDYELQHHNKALDLSLTIRFSGLPNNAQLDLVKLQKPRVEDSVQIFVQMEDGNRLSGSFQPSSMLSEIIQSLCPEDIKNKANPVIIFTRQEIIGDELERTNLRMLGLTHGTALLRLLHRTQEQLRHQAVSEGGIPGKKMKLSEKKKNKEPPKKSQSTEKPKSAAKPEKMDCDEQGSSKSGRSPIADALNSVEEQTTSVLNKIENLLKNVNPLKKSEEKMEVDEDTSSISNIDISSVEYIGDKKALLFKMGDIATPRFRDADDDFFNFTIVDAKVLLRDFRNSRCETENTQLTTEALRAQEKAQRLQRTVSRYPTCVVRILFQNRMALQGVFESTGNIADVTAFTRQFLTEPEMDFYLYTTPPKTILKPEEKLVDLGLPGLVIYFGTNQNATSSPPPCPIRQEFMDKAVSSNVAAAVVRYMKKPDEDIGETSQPIPVQGESSTSTSKDTRNFRPAERKPVNTLSSKVPKWFKFG